MKRHTRNALLFAIALGLLAASRADSVRGQFRKAPNYNLVEPGLWLGGWVDHPPEGTTAVLNVCDERDIFRVDRYLWMPLEDDGKGATLEYLEEATAWIRRQRKAGRTAFVHCREGVNRGPTVMAAYLMQEKGWTRNETLAFLRECRPVIRPNRAFLDLLLQWEFRLKERGQAKARRPGNAP